MSEKILRRLWLYKLPTPTAQILAPMAYVTPIHKLGDAVDKIHEGHTQRISTLTNIDEH